MSEQTPGPWTANGLSVSCAVGARDNTSICITTPNFKNDGSAYANARLIAAAPEMAAVLRMIVEERAHRIGVGGPFAPIDEQPDYVAMAMRVLAKAERLS